MKCSRCGCEIRPLEDFVGEAEFNNVHYFHLKCQGASELMTRSENEELKKENQKLSDRVKELEEQIRKTNTERDYLRGVSRLISEWNYEARKELSELKESKTVYVRCRCKDA